MRLLNLAAVRGARADYEVYSKAGLRQLGFCVKFLLEFGRGRRVAQQVSRTHISRKELKKDEFRESFAHGAEAVRSHQQSVALVVGALLLIAVAIIGWRIYSQRKTTQASAALDDAMKTYQARIRTAAEPVTDPNEVTYRREEQVRGCSKKFDGIVVSFGRTKPGQARYYAAICYEQLGKYDIAEQDLNAVESSGDNDLASLAKFQHAGLYATTGKTQPAIDLYNQLIRNDPSALVPKPVVMLSLAELYGRTNPPEATRLLNQIKVWSIRMLTRRKRRRSGWNCRQHRRSRRKSRPAQRSAPGIELRDDACAARYGCAAHARSSFSRGAASVPK